jgi:hypothetical protein
MQPSRLRYKRSLVAHASRVHGHPSFVMSLVSQMTPLDREDHTP